MAVYRFIGGKHDGSRFEHDGDTPPRRIVWPCGEEIETPEARQENTYDRVSFLIQGHATTHCYAPPDMNRWQVLSLLLERYPAG